MSAPLDATLDPSTERGFEKFHKGLEGRCRKFPLIASGGVNQHTAANFILAEATAIGVGTELIPPDAIERRASDRIRELAKRFIGFVKDARNRLAPTAEMKPKAKTDFWKFHKHAPTIEGGPE